MISKSSNNERQVYIFSKQPFDETKYDIFVSGRINKKERIESSRGNKYLKLFLVSSTNANLYVVVKNLDQECNEPEKTAKILKNTVPVFYVSKKGVPRFSDPPKSYCLQWLDDCSDFELCYTFLKTTNIFSNTFERCIKNRIHKFFFSSLSVIFSCKAKDISNFFFELMQYFNENNKEVTKPFIKDFLLMLAEKMLDINLIVPFSIVTFILLKHSDFSISHQYPIDFHHNDCFIVLEQLTTQAVYMYSPTFLVWAYGVQFHDDIVRIINANIRNLHKKINYKELAKLITIKLALFDRLDSNFITFLEFVQIFFKNGLFYIDDFFSSVEISNEQKEVAKKYFYNDFINNESETSENKKEIGFLGQKNLSSAIVYYNGVKIDSDVDKNPQSLSSLSNLAQFKKTTSVSDSIVVESKKVTPLSIKINKSIKS